MNSPHQLSALIMEHQVQICCLSCVSLMPHLVLRNTETERSSIFCWLCARLSERHCCSSQFVKCIKFESARRLLHPMQPLELVMTCQRILYLWLQFKKARRSTLWFSPISSYYSPISILSPFLVLNVTNSPFKSSPIIQANDWIRNIKSSLTRRRAEVGFVVSLNQ